MPTVRTVSSPCAKAPHTDQFQGLDGIRLELMFPSCWNGQDVDSPDHKSHVAFPDLVMTGTCPEGYPVKLPSLFYETIWNTYQYNGVDGQFLISTGDPTGESQLLRTDPHMY